MRFRILGPVEVLTPQGWRGIGAAKWRSLLSILLVKAGQVVVTDQLIAELWADEPPVKARKLVNLYVLRLRRLIDDPGGEILATRPVGYILKAGSDDLDATQFESQLAAAHDAAGRHQARLAGTLATAALELWRGPALSDVTVPSALLEAQRLDEARMSALVLRMEGELDAGRHAEVISELRELVGRHPMHEQFWGHLIRALRGTAREAEALQAYEQARRVIAEELGSDPGGELRALHQAMLAGRKSPASASASAAGVVKVGARPVRQLPPDVPDFTGRGDQVSELVQRLRPASGRTFVAVAVICGLAGVGKTSLALHVAHRLRGEFPDGQLYVQMDGTSERPGRPDELLGELLRSMGVQPADIPAGANERSAALRSALAGRRVLIFADDAAAASQITPLIPGDPHCAVIVTSRTMLAAIPGAYLLRLDPLAPGEAMEMLARIVGPDRVAAEPWAAQQLVAACACLPLAVRIVGARLAARPSWPVAQLTEMITDTRTRLSALTTTGLAARASFALSYEALPERARRAFRLVSLLGPSDFAEWPIASLLSVDDAHETVELLADKCILTPLGVDGTGEPRYHLHDLLRDYASEKLAEQAGDGGREAIERAITSWAELAHHASHALRPDLYYPPLARTPARVSIPADLARRVAAEPLAWFSAERANLIYMTERACSAGLLELANQLIAFQSTYQFYQGLFADHERLLQLLADAAGSSGHDRVLADTELRLAGLAAHRGDHARAMTLFRQSIDDLKEDADLPLRACGLYWYAYCASKAGDLQTALNAASQALVIARSLGDRETEIMALRALGEVYMGVGDHEAATSALEQACATSRDLADQYYEQLALRTLAHVAIQTRQWRRAVEVCNRGLELIGTQETVAGRAHFLSLLGNALNGLGQPEKAIRVLSDAVEIFLAHGDRRAEARCMVSLAQAHRALGYHQQAVLFLRESLPIFRELLLPAYERQALKELEMCRVSLQS
jgi:DNA-binding SARP family transcriptional activator